MVYRLAIKLASLHVTTRDHV